MSDLAFLDVSQASRLIQSGELSPVTYVEALLGHSERLEPDVKAWAVLDSQRALEQAKQCERDLAGGGRRAPLHGIPVALKDLFDVAGMETRAGTSLLEGNLAKRDSAAAARLRQAGAIIQGKTAMTFFAAMDPAETRNPWNIRHTPGGSSSGSAAAVASGMAPAALGSQTAGSVLRPAAYCGITGLKPTYDAISREGMFPCAWSMDHAGIMARTAEDAALVFDAVATGAGKGAGAPRKFVLGVPDRYFDDGLDPDVDTACQGALEALADAGVELRDVRLPDSFEAGVDAGIVTMYAEMAAVHRDRFAARREAYRFRITALIEEGLGISAADYLRAQQVRGIFIRDLSGLLDGIDALVTPTTPAPAPEGLTATGDWRFNLPFSASGHPAMTVPCGFSTQGMPVGLQFVAAHGHERSLLALGALFQGRTDWHRRQPTMVKEHAA